MHRSDTAYLLGRQHTEMSADSFVLPCLSLMLKKLETARSAGTNRNLYSQIDRVIAQSVRKRVLGPFHPGRFVTLETEHFPSCVRGRPADCWWFHGKKSSSTFRIVKTPSDEPTVSQLQLHVQQRPYVFECDFHDVALGAWGLQELDDLHVVTILKAGRNQLPSPGLSELVERRIERRIRIPDLLGSPVRRMGCLRPRRSLVRLACESCELATRCVVDAHRNSLSRPSAAQTQNTII